MGKSPDYLDQMAEADHKIIRIGRLVYIGHFKFFLMNFLATNLATILIGVMNYFTVRLAAEFALYDCFTECISSDV